MARMCCFQRDLGQRECVGTMFKWAPQTLTDVQGRTKTEDHGHSSQQMQVMNTCVFVCLQRLSHTQRSKGCMSRQCLLRSSLELRQTNHVRLAALVTRVKFSYRKSNALIGAGNPQSHCGSPSCRHSSRRVASTNQR